MNLLKTKKMKLLLLIFTISIVLLFANKYGYSVENKYEAAGFNDPDRVINFVTDLKESVKSNNIKHIANLIRYPLFVDIKGERVAIMKKKQFIENYSEIFDETVRNSILKSDPDDLFANSKGVMIGRGEIWLASLTSENKKVMLIITVNNHSPK